VSERESLRTALDEMRAEHERLGDAIAVLEKLVDGDDKGGVQPVKRGRKPVAKAVDEAAPAKRTFNKTCKECGANYIGAGPRTSCPKCNPKEVSATEWADRVNKKPRLSDRGA
jgi:cytochrome c5